MKNFFKNILGPKISSKELKEAISDSPNEYVAAWCRQLICEPIMNNKEKFFNKDYQEIENRRDLFVIALKILGKKLNNNWGYGYIKGFIASFMSTDYYIDLTVYDQKKKKDQLEEIMWRFELEESLTADIIKSEYKDIDFLEFSMNLKEYKKTKHKDFIKGYKDSLSDMKSFQIKKGVTGQDRPYVECKNLYKFLTK
jgi:hypothetical protein|tara:strand:- start:90 stop:680 length:591 start_codon:yes stop_codon:yes gene_type:complete